MTARPTARLSDEERAGLPLVWEGFDSSRVTLAIIAGLLADKEIVDTLLAHSSRLRQLPSDPPVSALAQAFLSHAGQVLAATHAIMLGTVDERRPVPGEHRHSSVGVTSHAKWRVVMTIVAAIEACDVPEKEGRQQWLDRARHMFRLYGAKAPEGFVPRGWRECREELTAMMKGDGLQKAEYTVSPLISAMYAWITQRLRLTPEEAIEVTNTMLPKHLAVPMAAHLGPA